MPKQDEARLRFGPGQQARNAKGAGRPACFCLIWPERSAQVSRCSTEVWRPETCRKIQGETEKGAKDPKERGGVDAPTVRVRRKREEEVRFLNI